MLKYVLFMMILVIFLESIKKKEVAKCFHGFLNYAPHSEITRYQNLCPIPSSSRIYIQISFTYPALPKPLSRPLFSFWGLPFSMYAFYMLSGPTHPLLACNTQWKCIGGLTPPPLGAYVINGRPLCLSTSCITT